MKKAGGKVKARDTKDTNIKIINIALTIFILTLALVFIFFIFKGGLTGNAINFNLLTGKAIDLNNGLQANYDFNGDVNDKSGNGINGIANGNVGFVEGPSGLGKAASFDGNSYINLSSNNFKIGDNNELTLSLWIKPNSLSGSENILARGAYMKPFRIWRENKRIRVTLRTNGIYVSGMYSNSSLVLGKWQHIALTYKSGKTKFYYNGLLDKEEFSNGTLNIENNQLTILGGIQTTTTINASFNGTIDELRIYNRVLSDEEIASLSELTISPQPICGNNILESGEECDSGNRSCIVNNVQGIQSCLANCVYGSCVALPSALNQTNATLPTQNNLTNLTNNLNQTKNLTKSISDLNTKNLALSIQSETQNNFLSAPGQAFEWGESRSNRSLALSVLTNAVKLSANVKWSLALRSDGSLYAWGDSSVASAIYGLPAGNDFVDATAGWKHGIACYKNGSVIEWGQPYDGSLDQWVANRPNISTCVQVVAGDAHSAVLLANGTILVWGARKGITKYSGNITHAVQIASGWYHIVALLDNGTVVTFGEATYTDDNGIAQNNTVPAGLNNVVKVFAGLHTSIAVKSDGTMVEWGLTHYNQSNPPANAVNIIYAAAGRKHTLALQANGTIIAWGDNSQGQLNVPANLNATFVGAGLYYSQAIGTNSSSLASTGCKLTSASWSSASVVNGTQVNLNVAGTNCLGKIINYTVYKSIWWWFDSKVMTSSSSGSTSWTANAPGTYYFHATEAQNASNNVQSGNLVVTISQNILNGQCGSTVNSCISGNLEDINDNSTNYKWNCLGLNGGSDASCNLPISESNLALIPAGTFQMGDSFGNDDPFHYDLPIHSVTLNSFYMAETEVTNKQFAEVLQWAYDHNKINLINNVIYNIEGQQKNLINLSYSLSKISFNGTAFNVVLQYKDHPVEKISWYGAVAYSNYLSDMNGFERCVNFTDWSINFSKECYRLPTESEWEYASRGGLDGKRFPWGDNISQNEANYNAKGGIDAKVYDLSAGNNSHPSYIGNMPHTNPVKDFSSNGYGLYGMAGNAYEFVWDWYSSYTSSPQVNPTGPISGTNKIIRGGSWQAGAERARCSSRYYSSITPDSDIQDVGFRVVRSYVFSSPSQNNVELLDTAGKFISNYTTIQACANVVSPGQTCLVNSGIYDERVTTARNGTSETNRTTFRAKGKVIMNGFLVVNKYVTIEGFTIKGATNPDQKGLIEVMKWTRGEDGSYCRIVNNTIGPGVYATSDDYSFNNISATKAEITSNKVDFISLGFRPGMNIYVGARSYDAPLNHDMSAFVIDVTSNKLTVVNITAFSLSYADIGNETYVPKNRPFRYETNVLATLFIIPSTDKEGVNAISLDSLDSNNVLYVPSNCYIGYNNITDHMAKQIVISGNNHLIEHNDIGFGHGFTVMFLRGKNNTISYNYIHDGYSPFYINWTRNGDVYRNSGYYWDFSGNVIAFFGANGSNVIFEDNKVDHNFIRDISDQLTKFDAYKKEEQGLDFTNNVYVNIRSASAGFSVNNMAVKNNIFYNVSYGEDSPDIAFPMAPSGSSNLSHLEGMEIFNNVFIGVGGIDASSSYGWFSIKNATVLHDYNYISGFPPGYSAKDEELVNESHTISNGTNPLFQNISNPLGPDGKPWTNDDGFIPLENSPLCMAGYGVDIGAYKCGDQYALKVELLDRDNNFIKNYSSIQGCADEVIAGQTCLVYPGNYNERIDFERSGTSNNFIKFKALPGAVSRGFYITGNYINITGFTFKGEMTGYGGFMVDVLGDNIELSNNNFTGISNFFGGMINLGGSFDVARKNNIVGWISDVVESTAIQAQGSNNIIDSNLIRDCSDINVFRAFGSNHIFRNNTVLNIFDGPVGTHIDFIQTFGNNGEQAYNITIEHNFVKDLESGQISQLVQCCGKNFTGGAGCECIQMYGVNGDIDSFTKNTITDNSFNWIVGQWQINHWSGYIVSLVSGNATGKIYLINASNGSTLTVTNIDGSPANLTRDNVSIRDNYQIRNRIGWWTFKNNVFINIDKASASIANLEFIGNTFINAGSVFGGGGDDRGLAHNGRVLNNVHIFPGLKPDVYDPSNVSSTFYADYNYVSQEAPAYLPKRDSCDQEYTVFNFCETQFGKHGLNGGDPFFKNIDNPLGNDGIPFTSDDGLIPLSGFKLCNAANDGGDIGAYSCQGCIDDNPIAYFSADASSGYEPLIVNFNASNSKHCNLSISSYVWDLGDTTSAAGPYVSHSYSYGSYIIRLNVTNNLGKKATYSRSVNVLFSPVPGLVLFHNFNNPDNLFDWSGKTHTSEWVGNKNIVPGHSGEAISTENSYVQTRSAEDIDSMKELTVSIWAKRNGLNASLNTIILKHKVFRIRTTPTFVDAYVNNESGVQKTVSSSSGINDLNWHHYALTFNKSNIVLYVDGVRKASSLFNGSLASVPLNNLWYGFSFSNYFNGSIDDVGIYNRALNDSEITCLYDGTGCISSTQPICGNSILESGEECDDGNLDNNDGCSNLCKIETPQISCQLTSASWSSASVVNGTQVNLNVAGTNCLGKIINYTVYKSIWWWFDSKVMTSSSSGSTSWTANAPGTYYFHATEAQNASNNVQSGNLVVTRASAICIDNDRDGYNITSSDERCGILFDCNDNNADELPGQIWYKDMDGDRYSSGISNITCYRLPKFNLTSELIAISGDCNDSNNRINPSAIDVCNLIDDNCNKVIDENNGNCLDGFKCLSGKCSDIYNCTDLDRDGLKDYNNNSNDENYCPLGKDKCIQVNSDLSSFIPFNPQFNLTYENTNDLRNVSSVRIEKKNIGRIMFKEKLRLVGLDETGCFVKLNLTNKVEISLRKVIINSTLILELNKSADILFENVSLNNPIILRDSLVCSDCYILDYNRTANNILINVSGFSTYELVEQCSDSIQDGDETGVDCGGNCSACSSPPPGGGGGSGGGGGADRPKVNLTLNQTNITLPVTSGGLGGENESENVTDEGNDGGENVGDGEGSDIKKFGLSWLIILLAVAIVVAMVLVIIFFSRLLGNSQATP